MNKEVDMMKVLTKDLFLLSIDAQTGEFITANDIRDKEKPVFLHHSKIWMKGLLKRLLSSE